MTVQNVQSFDLQGPENPTLTLDGMVLCTAVGDIFDAPGDGSGFNIDEEWAVTTAQTMQQEDNYFIMEPKCSNNSSPADYEPTVYYLWPYQPTNPPPEWYLYLKGKTFCVAKKDAYGRHWICGPSLAFPGFTTFGKLIKGLDGEQFQANANKYGDGVYPHCTNQLAGYEGVWENAGPPN
jgi:hypothetical protein